MSKRHQHRIVTEAVRTTPGTPTLRGRSFPFHRARGVKVRGVSVENLNQVLVDTMTLRDMYKKHHWQVSGPTFYQLHLLFGQALRRTERAGGLHRGANSVARPA